MAARRKRWWVKWAFGGAVAVAGLGVVYLFNPTDGYMLYPPCFTHRFTGFHCPGCGTGRATYDLVHGRPLTALGHNPMLLLLVPILLYIVTDRLLQDATGRRLPNVRWPRWVWVALPVLVIAFTVLRNLPGKPWDWLGP